MHCCALSGRQIQKGGDICIYMDLLGLSGKESACQTRNVGLIPGSGRSPGKGNVNPLQCSCLGNPMDRGLHAVSKESDPS